MEIGKTRYVKDRKAWRAWLARNHEKQPEIWLIFYKKHTGKQRIPYNDAVEEALCFGWIDSIVKRVDDERTAQRFSPRRPNSFLSETNKERIRVGRIESSRVRPDVFKTRLDYLVKMTGRNKMYGMVR